MSAERPWTHIKIRKATAARMAAVARRIVELVEQGVIADPGVNPEPKCPLASGLSMDALINLLLDERDSHNQRARESRARRKRTRDSGGEGT